MIFKHSYKPKPLNDTLHWELVSCFIKKIGAKMKSLQTNKPTLTKQNKVQTSQLKALFKWRLFVFPSHFIPLPCTRYSVCFSSAILKDLCVTVSHLSALF